MDFKKLNEFSILSIAYLGDSVWELEIRDYFVRKNLIIKDLNDLVREYVNAKAQSRFYLSVFDELEPEFQNYSKRGRNANINSYPKSCTPKEYRNATAFEVLIGAYHLLGETEKLKELTKKIIEGDLVEKKV